MNLFIIKDKLRKHIEEVVALTNETHERVKTFFTLRRVKKHQYLIQEGDQATYEYLVLSGIFRMFYLDEGGKEYIVQFAGQNWWMADYQAYFPKKPATWKMPKCCSLRWKTGKHSHFPLA